MFAIHETARKADRKKHSLKPEDNKLYGYTHLDNEPTAEDQANEQ